MPRTNAATELDRSFSGLKAIFLNCTLKASPGMSYTGRLIRIARMIMKKRGVQTELIRRVDFELAPACFRT